MRTGPCGLPEAVTDRETLAVLETGAETQGRELLRRLLQAHLDRRGSGDAGPAIDVDADDGPTRFARGHRHNPHTGDGVRHRDRDQSQLPRRRLCVRAPRRGGTVPAQALIAEQRRGQTADADPSRRGDPQRRRRRHRQLL